MQLEAPTYNFLRVLSYSKPDALLTCITQAIKRKDHIEEIQTTLQCNLDNKPDVTCAEMQAHVWLQWARQKKHLKVNNVNCHLVLCQAIFFVITFAMVFVRS